MKKKTLLPQITAPVKRQSTASAAQGTIPGVDSSWLNGDNNWSTPFASVDASWLNGDNNWSTPFAADGAE